VIDAKDAIYSQLRSGLTRIYSEATNIATRVRKGDVQTLATRFEVSVVVLAMARTAPRTVALSIVAQLTCSV
jgi:phosphate uptake regulator